MDTELTQAEQYQLPLKSALFLTIAALAGLIASLGLLYTEISHLNNPQASFSCDLSILVGCSSSINSPEAHLFFGIPNSALGIAFFTLLTFVGLGSFTHLTLPRILWNLLAAANLASLLVITFFLHASIFKFQALCPFCLVVWSATFISAGIIIPWASAICRRETVSSIGRTLHANAWALITGLFLLTAVTVLLGLSEKIGMML